MAFDHAGDQTSDNRRDPGQSYRHDVATKHGFGASRDNATTMRPAYLLRLRVSDPAVPPSTAPAAVIGLPYVVFRTYPHS